MAKRPIFLPDTSGRLVEERTLEFEWFPGFAVAQKQRSIEALHQSASPYLDRGRLLEVSTKSPERLGVQLSAFNLEVENTGSGQPVLLEAAFQGSKVFENQGPFTHLYGVRSGREVKQFMSELPEDQLVGFRYEGHEWTLSPKTAFYDWLYLKATLAVSTNDDLLDEHLLGFDAFSDIEFNPDKSFNCQARSCALYVSLLKTGLLRDALADPESFVEVLEHHGYGVDFTQGELI